MLAIKRQTDRQTRCIGIYRDSGVADGGAAGPRREAVLIGRFAGDRDARVCAHAARRDDRRGRGACEEYFLGQGAFLGEG